MSSDEVSTLCGSNIVPTDQMPCFLIVASDGLWDTIKNQEAVDMVAQIISEETLLATTTSNKTISWQKTACLQKAAEALTLESYVRGSTDNIGVCIIALD